MMFALDTSRLTQPSRLARFGRAAVIPALIFAVVGVFVIVAVQDRAARRSASAEEARQAAFFIAASVKTAFVQYDRALSELASWSSAGRNVPGPAQRALAALESLVPSIAGASVLDQSGTLIARSADPAHATSLAVIEAAAFRAISAGRTTTDVITPLVYDAAFGTDLVGIARASYDPSGALDRVVLVAIAPSRFAFLRSLRVLREGGELAILTLGGAPLIRVPRSRNPEIQAAESQLLMRELPRSQEASFLVQSASGDELLISYRGVDDVPLVVSYSRSMQDVEVPWRTMWEINALIVSVAVAGFLVLGAMLKRTKLRSEAIEHQRQAREAETIRLNMERLAAAAAGADEANRAKSRFFAHMTHELRTPLNAILGFPEVMRGELFGPVGNPRYVEYAGLIHNSGSHLLSLITDLLDMSKVEAGKLEVSLEPVSAAAIAGPTADLVKLIADERSLSLTVSGVESCPSLYVDPRAMRQILVNLLSNAIKFTHAGGRVELTFGAQPDGNIAISVADTGIGMSASEVETALEPFGQVRSELARPDQGTGLGLPLAKALTALQGGDLRILSRPGEGTTVVLTFPPAPNAALRQTGETPVLSAANAA